MKPLNVAQLTKEKFSHLRTLIAANQDSPEAAFLPAALEVVERPPSPLGRGVIYTICAFFVVALVWSYFGQVDEVATAQGHVIPSGKVKVIQPLEIGAVSKIDVTEGQYVKKGDVLVEIDPTESRAEAERLAQELKEDQLDALRDSTMAKADIRIAEAEKEFSDQIPTGTDQALIDRQLALLRSALTEQGATVAALDSSIEQKQAERRQIETDITKLHETLPLMSKRAKLRDNLVAHGYSSVIEASKEDQALIEGKQALAEDMHKLDENKASLEQLSQQRQEAVSKFISTTLTNGAEATRKAQDDQQQLIKAQDLANRRTLTAPVEGVVQQLMIHTVGGIVTPAQELMVIVPKDAPLEVEAMVKNMDIGFVRVGQQVELKLETFPFTRYGLRHGIVTDISRDSTTNASSSQQQGKQANTDTGQTAQLQADNLYTAHISLDQSVMPVDGKMVPLTPGMAVTAEIKTDRQRVINYLLDPLRRYRHDSFQER